MINPSAMIFGTPSDARAFLKPFDYDAEENS